MTFLWLLVFLSTSLVRDIPSSLYYPLLLTLFFFSFFFLFYLFFFVGLSHTHFTGGNEESKICFGKFTPRHAKVIDYWATRLTIGGYTLVTIVMLIQAKVHRDQYEFQLTVGPV